MPKNGNIPDDANASDDYKSIYEDLIEMSNEQPAQPPTPQTPLEPEKGLSNELPTFEGGPCGCGC